MTNTKQPTNTDSPQLSELQKQLNELKIQVSDLKKQMSQNNHSFTKESVTDENSNLPERISHIENSLSLVSDIVRYKPLRDLLAAQKWEEADKETIRLIADIAGHTDLEDFRPAEVQHFPCVQLQVIDHLWLTYSKERFGFSIQARIYQEEGGNVETTIEQNGGIIEKWGKRLGWRENNRWKKCGELDWTLNAPVGCHPSRWWNSPFGSKMTNYFLARLITCELNQYQP
jgi:regulator of replication initiation timing